MIYIQQALENHQDWRRCKEICIWRQDLRQAQIDIVILVDMIEELQQ